MNATQQKYAVKRLYQIAKAHRTATEVAYKVPAKVLTVEDFIEKVKAGVIAPRWNGAAHHLSSSVTAHCIDIRSLFDLGDLATSAYMKPGYDEAIKAIEKATQDAEDRIMLGEDGLQALAAFEALAF